MSAKVKNESTFSFVGEMIKPGRRRGSAETSDFCFISLVLFKDAGLL